MHIGVTWPLPIIFTSWGFRHKGDRWNNGTELADWCKSCHIATVAVQLGNDHHGCVNTELADVEPLRKAGVHVLVWGVAEPDYVRRELDRLHALDSDWFPQVENDPERNLVFRQIQAGLAPQGIVTTYGGASTPDDIRRLRDGGVTQVHVESYAEVPGHENLDSMLWQGTQYGWHQDELYACMGTYRGEMPGAYLHLELTAKGYSLYLAEPMSGAQWVAFGELSQQPLPPDPPTPEDEMEQVTDQQGRDAVLFAAQAATQNWTSDKPKARLTVARRVCQAETDDPKWNACRDKIVKALDEAGIPA